MSKKRTASPALLEGARITLQENSRQERYTVPSGRLYPYQWNWDSGFIALGWLMIEPQRAVAELESLLVGQWKSGKVPHIVFHEFQDHYAPGPLDWQVPDDHVEEQVQTSGITQPPILGSVLYRLYQGADDDQRDIDKFTKIYKGIKRYHEWFMTKRTSAPDHDLVKSVHPWESGMDNLPSWDDLLDKVPDEDLSSFVRKDLNADNASHRPEDKDYRAYMSLVYHYRRIGYDAPDFLPQAHFRVYDLVLNSLLLRSARDMQRLAILLGQGDNAYWAAQISCLAKGMQKLWCEKTGAFLNRCARDGVLLQPITSASFLPLYAGAANKEQADHLARIYERWHGICRYSVPSTDPESSVFDEERYWRGPIWLNINWMISEGFADYGYEDIAAQIRADSLKLLEDNGFYEYFSPLDGHGAGADGFSWSAALALYWLGQ